MSFHTALLWFLILLKKFIKTFIMTKTWKWLLCVIMSKIFKILKFLKASEIILKWKLLLLRPLNSVLIETFVIESTFYTQAKLFLNSNFIFRQHPKLVFMSLFDFKLFLQDNKEIDLKDNKNDWYLRISCRFKQFRILTSNTR